MYKYCDNSPQKEIMEKRTVKDNVHGNITLSNTLWNIVDTPEYQRMRDIKQLGAVFYVYPGATHTRFEHCIGTGFLALKLATQLKAKSDISKRDINNIAIAGLTHDLGHATYSHLFEKLVMKKL